MEASKLKVCHNSASRPDVNAVTNIINNHTENIANVQYKKVAIKIKP